MIDTRLYHSVPVEITDENFPKHLDWCFENCSGHFRDLRVQSGKRTWYFELEQDALLFSLKWSGENEDIRNR